MKSLPCIVCDKQTEAVFDHELQPSQATAFTTTGHYGSTAFDPMDLSELTIVICDECLVKKGKAGVVALTQPRIGISADFPMTDNAPSTYAIYPVGYYSPEDRSAPVMTWDPDKAYTPQDPTRLEPEEVLAMDLPKSTMLNVSAWKHLKELEEGGHL